MKEITDTHGKKPGQGAWPVFAIQKRKKEKKLMETCSIPISNPIQSSSPRILLIKSISLKNVEQKFLKLIKQTELKKETCVQFEENK